MCRVLFVYANREGYPIIPHGISVLAGILKYHKHEVDLFDITFMVPEKCDHRAREKTGVVQTVDVEKYWGSGGKKDMDEELRKKILSFGPDLIAFSIVENNYVSSRKFFAVAKQTTKARIIVGGLFPTIRPDLFLEDPNVDIVCVGEGEYAIEKLAERLDRGQDISNIPNLMVKNGKKIFRNALAKHYDWEPFILQDWSIFDKRHLMKPFMGKMYRTGFFELSRGCPFQCAYCLNRLCQKIFKDLGSYNRKKPMEYAIKEIEWMKKEYALELVFFNDENFLTMNKERLADFCEKYQSRVNLPFFLCTRADSLLDEQKVAILKESGCITIGVGVESGNEQIRKELLNKNIPNSVFEKAFKICHKNGIRTTANFMLGLPFETEENILQSVRFCRQLEAKSVTLAIFAPYQGTLLREVCVRNGFMEDRLYDEISILDHSLLNMPQISKEKIEEYYYKFNELVYGNGGEN